MSKRTPEAYTPPDCVLTLVANYAHGVLGKSPARVYQLFQEGKLKIVTVDGQQFVQTPKKIT